MNIMPIKVKNMKCRQIAIINNKIVCDCICTYTEKDFDNLIRDGWNQVYNGIESNDDGIYTIIQKI